MPSSFLLALCRRVLLLCAFATLASCGNSTSDHAALAASASASPQARAQADMEEMIAVAASARLDAPALPLSAMAELGRKIFYDVKLSGSGKMACASCHDPGHAYAPGNNLAAQLGGVHMQSQGGRAVPSLRYHEYAPPFSIGPDVKPDDDDKQAVQQSTPVKSAAPIAATAKAGLAPNAAADEMVPQGGFDWDGRAVNLSDQAGGPLLASNEMDNGNAAALLAKLKAAPYAGDMRLLFGPGVFTSPAIALGEAYFALARYQTEERSFHPYDSKYDYYLARRVQLSEQETRGLNLFKDPKKGNCATCHIEKPSRDGRLPPAFTDYQFEALAVPRNPAILANRDSRYFDLGMCGPWRKDYADQSRYCGFFKTPTLRNVATRQVFFHNGVFHSLDEVLHFYVERETKPEKWYRNSDGKVEQYNDLPQAYRGNVDHVDAPFDRKPGDAPALSESEIQDVIAFLKTLTDGYRP